MQSLKNNNKQTEKHMTKIEWESMKNLSDLTLIMPTYNRQKYALRQMKFWSDSPVKICVLDGTSTSIIEKELKDLGENVHYNHMKSSYEERMRKSVDLINTEYSASLCDDEFFIPSALEKCIGYLKNNGDFIACMGRCMRLNNLNNKVAAKIQYENMKNYSITGNNGKDRMLKHMSPYLHSTMYAVQRAEAWKKSMSIFPSNAIHFSCPYVMEILFELSTCYQGKSIVLDELMWLRSEENAPAHGESRRVKFQDWIQKKIYVEEVLLFYKKTMENIAKLYGSDETIADDFRAAIERYVNGKNEYEKSKKTDLTKIKRNIAERISVRREHQISTFFAYLNINGWSSWKRTAERLEKQKVHVDYKQLGEIVNILADFNVK
jgi:glycosyltransferase domain-containing protein